MKTHLTALTAVSLGSLASACASSTDAPIHYSHPPAIQVDYPDVAMPTVSTPDFMPEVVPEATVPLRTPDAPASTAFICGGITIAPAPELYGTTWRVRSISSTRTSSQTRLTEEERYFSDWYDDLKQPTVIFHLEPVYR